MQLRRVTVKNIQAIEDLTIELSTGLTVVVGDNESGKTALIRAILACLTNADAKFERRKGTDKSEVALLFDDGTEKGLSVLWTRKQGRSSATISYLIGGREYTRMGRSVPERLKQIAFPWKIGGSDFGLVQIQEQNSPAFLVTEMSMAASKAWDALEGQDFRSVVDSCKSLIKKEASVQSQCSKKLNFYKDSIDGRLEMLDDLFISSQKDVREARSLYSLLLKRKLKVIEEAQLEFSELFRVLVLKLREKVDVSELLRRANIIYGLTKVYELRVSFGESLKELASKKSELDGCDKGLTEFLDCPYYKETGECVLLNNLLGV